MLDQGIEDGDIVFNWLCAAWVYFLLIRVSSATDRVDKTLFRLLRRVFMDILIDSKICASAFSVSRCWREVRQHIRVASGLAWRPAASRDPTRASGIITGLCVPGNSAPVKRYWSRAHDSNETIALIMDHGTASAVAWFLCGTFTFLYRVRWIGRA